MSETPRRTDLNFEEFRKLLLAERARLAGVDHEQRADMRAEAMDASDNERGTYSTFDPADPGDNAAALYDQERDAALEENEHQLLAEVDHALDRLDNGTYGICEVTGQPIPVARLRALPWATMTVEAAERADK